MRTLETEISGLTGSGKLAGNKQEFQREKMEHMEDQIMNN